MTTNEIQYFYRSDLIKYIILSEWGSFAIGWLFYRSVAVAFIMAVLPVLFYKKYKSYLLESRKEKINLEFKDVLYAFSDAAASGKQADVAIVNAYKNLRSIYGEGATLTKEFEYMSVRVRETRDSPERLLAEFGNRIGVEDIRNFMEIYYICIRSGGDKHKAINKAAEIIMERISMKQELSVALVQKKIEAVILCCIPAVVLVFMQISSGEYSEVLYNTLQGRVVMTVCLMLALWAAALCLKIMDIKI